MHTTHLPSGHNLTCFNHIVLGEVNYPLGRDTTYFRIVVKDECKVIGPLDETSYLRLADSRCGFGNNLP